MPTEPELTKAHLVRGWQIRPAMGMAALIVGIDASDERGEHRPMPQTPLLLSQEHCRQLAKSLLQAADQLEASAGSEKRPQ